MSFFKVIFIFIFFKRTAERFQQKTKPKYILYHTRDLQEAVYLHGTLTATPAVYSDDAVFTYVYFLLLDYQYHSNNEFLIHFYTASYY